MNNSLIRLLSCAAIIGGLLFSTSCDEVEDLFENIPLTETEVVNGLKEALTVGIDTSVTVASATNGYFGNQLVKVLLPDEADPIIDAIQFIPGSDQLIDELVLKLNRAAESAATQATPIFVNAITNITIDDGFSILNGGNNAATNYLQTNTQTQLYTAFKPDIENALIQVGAQQVWGEVIDLYNDIPFLPEANADLADHTTTRALDGLFHYVAEEEADIRTNANARVTDLLERVFGNQ